jgi:hypothetical protein
MQGEAYLIWRKLFNPDPATTDRSFIHQRKVHSSVALKRPFEISSSSSSPTPPSPPPPPSARWPTTNQTNLLK